MKVLKLQVFNGTDMREWKVYEGQPVVKIGSDPSNTLQLPGLSPHAALIESDGDSYRILDLGGDPSTYVSGEKIRNVLLRNGDTIHFGQEGPWSLRVTVESGFGIDTAPMPKRSLKDIQARLEKRKQPRSSFEDIQAASERTVPYHHQRTFDGLCAQLLKQDDGDSMRRLIAQYSKTFDTYDDAKKASKLLVLVGLLRESRKDHRFDEVVGVGVAEAAIRSMREGSKLFDLTEEQATERATDRLCDLKEAKESIGFLRKLQSVWAKEKNADAIQRGCHRVEQELAKRTSVFLMELVQCLARAGNQSKKDWLAQQAETEKSMLEGMDALTEQDLDKFSPVVLEYLNEVRSRHAQ